VDSQGKQGGVRQDPVSQLSSVSPFLTSVHDYTTHICELCASPTSSGAYLKKKKRALELVKSIKVHLPIKNPWYDKNRQVCQNDM
jgi:hypothetical protein